MNSILLLEVSIPIKTRGGNERHIVQAFIRKRWYGTSIDIISTYSDRSCKAFDYQYDNADRLRSAKKYLREVCKQIAKMRPESAMRFCEYHKITIKVYDTE